MTALIIGLTILIFSPFIAAFLVLSMEGSKALDAKRDRLHTIK